jgi:hypothetical protein
MSADLPVARDSKPIIVLAVVTALAVAALWLAPPIGFVAAMVLLVILPPWGRSLTERAVISTIVLMGLVAIAFPRAGSTPVTQTSSRVALSVLLVVVLALRMIPRLRGEGIPGPTVSDALVAALAVVSAWWLMAAYIGRQAYEIVSGLYFSGWDNQAHFTTFANTYKVGSTTWPTVDGGLAWNQWYPSLHSTLWSLAELASRSTSQLLDRPGLLWPYVQWNAISFALSLGGLAWVAGDLAARFGDQESAGRTRSLAIGAFAVFGLLGSPALLYNAGFTNFMMGVAVMVVVAYVSARSWRSARLLGWFLVPLGAMTIIGLWTPLVLGLVPSGVVVAIALLKSNRWLGGAWLLASAAVGVGMMLTQSQAILGVEPGKSTADFTTGLGAVGTGMTSFNVGAALLAPVIAVLFAVLAIRRRQWPVPVALLGPVLAGLVIALVFSSGADAAHVGRLQSYYVLKALDAMLLAAAPLVAALASVALVRALRGVRRSTVVISTVLAGVVAVAMFGYVGVVPEQRAENLAMAPGIVAGQARYAGIDDPLVGDAIIRARDAAVPYPEYTTLLWDGAGTLPNLWVASLSTVISKSQDMFYQGLPSFPYDQKAAQYVSLSMNLDARLRVVVLWFRTTSGELLDAYVKDRGDDRVKPVKVPMPSSPLCEECSL